MEVVAPNTILQAQGFWGKSGMSVIRRLDKLKLIQVSYSQTLVESEWCLNRPTIICLE